MPPTVVEGNKVTLHIPVPPQTDEFAKRLQVILRVGDETARGECNFTVKRNGGGPVGPTEVVGEAKPAKEVRRYDGPKEKVSAIALSPDGKTLLAAGSEGKLWF
jgi:hypothetical protein